MLFGVMNAITGGRRGAVEPGQALPTPGSLKRRRRERGHSRPKKRQGEELRESTAMTKGQAVRMARSEREVRS